MVRFITVEGGDGTGKTTALNAIVKHLDSRGLPCVVTREPGGTPLGRVIRQILVETGEQPLGSRAELFLYLADRAQHVDYVITPALESGKIVISDRYTDSTLAYQGYGRGIDLKLLRELNQLADGGVEPDLTLLLDCPVKLALARTARRRLQSSGEAKHEDRFEQEDLDFHERVRAGFIEMARAEPERFRIINAARPAEMVAEEIRRLLERESW
jgi:dTMP kinase